MSERLRAIATAIALSFLASLCLGYLATHVFGRHTIVFYPRQSVRVAMNSDATVSAAISAVHDADDLDSLNTAIGVVQRMVAAGDAEAAFRLGRYYHLESATPDYGLALNYYQIAVDAGHAWATNNLGLLYRDGLGVPRNDTKAYEYFHQAAARKSTWGYVNLAEMTLQGRGVTFDKRAGMAVLDEGAANGCTQCLTEEAAIYHTGDYGVRRNPDKTVALLAEADELGDAHATVVLAKLYLVGDGVAQSSVRSQEILKVASDHGNAEASNLLGELTADEQILDYTFDSALGGVRHIPADFHHAFPQDPLAAIRYWDLATQQGDCQSLINLSSVFDRGIGVDPDPGKAASYVKQAVRCEPNDSFYLWKLGMRYFDANGAVRDCVSAAKLFAQSLNHGYAGAAVNLGYIYDKGCGPIANDDHRAFQTYLLGAKLGVALCQNNVGAMLKHGRGVPQADVARGYGWIKLASLNGDELARKNLRDSLFTPEVRAIGLTELADIQARLAVVPSDSQKIMNDPWY